MSISKNSPMNGDSVMIAYRDRVQQEIENELLSDILPKVKERVRDAAKKAADALEGAIQERYDIQTRDTLVRL